MKEGDRPIDPTQSAELATVKRRDGQEVELRITWRPSGSSQGSHDIRLQGRGEYEISETHAGITPRDVLNRGITLVFAPGIEVETFTYLIHQGGKFRLRQMPGSACEIHLHWQFAVARIMPEPHRDSKEWGVGPVQREFVARGDTSSDSR